MVNKICDFLLKKMRKEMPDIDDEKAEILYYGLQNIVGEIPKLFIMMAIAYFLGVFELSVITFLIILPYRIFSGGFHLKTHIGCIVTTSLFYIGNAFLSKNIIIETIFIKYILIAAIWIFSIIMIKLYAPADTEAVPILRKKDRNLKRKLSYITMTITLICAVIIKDNIISNLLIFGTLLQTISISGFMYKITKCKFGYREYIKLNNIA